MAASTLLLPSSRPSESLSSHWISFRAKMISFVCSLIHLFACLFSIFFILPAFLSFSLFFFQPPPPFFWVGEAKLLMNVFFFLRDGEKL